MHLTKIAAHNEQLNVALGRLAPKGTWLCEVLENIWRAPDRDAAVKIAEEANREIQNQGFWTGPRLNGRTADLERQLAEAQRHIQLAGGYHQRTKREIEISEALEETPADLRDSADNTIAELLELVDAGRNRVHAAETERDQLREQLAEAKRERDVFRAVLEGFQYEKIDKLAGEPLDVARRVGEMALERVADTITGRDQLRADLAAARKQNEEIKAAAIGVIDRLGAEYLDAIKRNNETLAQSGNWSGFVNPRTPEWVSDAREALSEAFAALTPTTEGSA